MKAANTGCMMCHSLYVKANGEVPCWDDVGENQILWQFEDSAPLFHHPELIRIRQSFQDGIEPFPDLCGKCAVKGCGPAGDLQPTTMQVLHLEASYLCHLSCPQCIPALERKHLKAPPYHMTRSMLEDLLQRLKSEGIRDIVFVHFEGRGDPLANTHLDELVRVTKQYYPRTLTAATTHGSYLFHESLLQCGLDFLRVSIDGAFPKNYRKYRVGGDFDKVVTFLYEVREGKRRTGSHLQVEWKYILFDWNDSDREIECAARMAKELQVRLRFVLTHTPGRSRRFQSVSAVTAAINRLAPGAGIDKTFQLKSPEDRAVGTDSVVAEHVTALLVLTLQMVGARNEEAGLRHLRAALEHDPGIHCECDHANCGDLLECHLDAIVSQAQFPATLSWAAGVCREYGKGILSSRLLRRYLELAPYAPDFDHVLKTLQ